nr:MAG TPA: Protein of unknown function (DUF3422) [Bacteriophage sp.]
MLFGGVVKAATVEGLNVIFIIYYSYSYLPVLTLYHARPKPISKSSVDVLF